MPAITSQGGRLGGQLGSTVLALGGVAGPLVSNLRAASVLAIAQTAVPAPTFAAHASPRWVLGGQDAYLGGEQLAFAGAASPQPATGTRTGKLGTPTSLLAGMRLALGQQEGGGGATITYVTAASVLAASSSAAVAGIVRAPAAASTLALTGAAGVGCVRGESATSALALTEAAAAGAVRNVAAAHALDLTDAVTDCGGLRGRCRLGGQLDGGGRHGGRADVGGGRRAGLDGRGRPHGLDCGRCRLGDWAGDGGRRFGRAGGGGGQHA